MSGGSQAIRVNIIYAIRGLVSRPELNGSRCVVTGQLDVAKSRWPVRVLESGEMLLIREENLCIEETMSDDRFCSTDAGSNYAAKRARINASLHLRQGITVEDAEPDASNLVGRVDCIRRMVQYLGHELSSSDGVKFIVNSAGSVRLVATRDIPRRTAILQLPANLRFSIANLAVESGLATANLRERVREGMGRAGAASPFSEIDRRFTVCDPDYFLQVCQIIAACHKLQDVSVPPSSFMRMCVVLFSVNVSVGCRTHLRVTADFSSTMKRCLLSREIYYSIGQTKTAAY
jgi:hypothetical protein